MVEVSLPPGGIQRIVEVLEPHRARFIEFLKQRRAHALDIAENVARFMGAP